ncbi:MAG: SPASM domain-containing protein [Syntrophotaleaceae bacterium]
MTNLCNLSCSFCHQSKRPKSFVTPAEFDHTLRQIGGFTDYLALHLLGEPLLHPDLALLLASCHAHGKQVNLTTNATLLPQSRETLLASPALRQINISLHSFENAEGLAALHAYLEDVFDFIHAAQAKNGPYISLRLWNLRDKGAASQNEATRQLLKRLETFFFLPMPIPAMLTPGQGIRLAPGVFLSQEPEFHWPHALPFDQGDRGFCRGLRDHIGILADGTVVPCCLDAEGDIPLGSIHHQGLGEILDGDRARRMRDGFSRQQVIEDLCRRCTYRQRFAKPAGLAPANAAAPA